MQLDQIKIFFPLVGPLVALVISAVVLPYVRQWLVLYREHHQIIKRQFFEYTEVMLFGVFENRVEYDAWACFARCSSASGSSSGSSPGTSGLRRT
jgi:hypothetical protein